MQSKFSSALWAVVCYRMHWHAWLVSHRHSCWWYLRSQGTQLGHPHELQAQVAVFDSRKKTNVQTFVGIFGTICQGVSCFVMVSLKLFLMHIATWASMQSALYLSWPLRLLFWSSNSTETTLWAGGTSVFFSQTKLCLRTNPVWIE